MADDQEKKPGGGGEDEFEFPSEDFQTSSDPAQQDQGSDFGALTSGDQNDLSNLPPLSEFESADSGGGGGDDFGGLPPLSDIQVDTPTPDKGGGSPATPTDLGTAFHTPASDSDLDTPTPGVIDTPQGGGESAFQDLAADSDFSPETPEIGPGPDTDLETPMFDSAFGGGDDFGSSSSSTDAPTQAMETPMFGDSSGDDSTGDDVGFASDAFGGGDFGAPTAPDSPAGPGFEAGTPVPDFSPDTGVPGGTPAPPAAPSPGRKKAAKGGGVGMLVAIILAIVGLVAGIFGGPYIPGLPNPLKGQLDQMTSEKDRYQRLYEDMVNAGPVTNASGKTTEELIAEKAQLIDEVRTANAQAETANAAALEAQTSLREVQADLDDKSNQYVEASIQYDRLQNQLAITNAQRDGLDAEIQRFQNLVGELGDANTRRIMTKDALEHAVARLEALIREGSPLMPAKYAWQGRVDRVTSLSTKVGGSNWVSPQLFDEYSNLFLDELEIAGSRDFFFAQIPVESRIGSTEIKWAECLMNGNWSTYFRTLDGKSIGIYQNTADAGPASYRFRQFLEPAIEKQVEQEIISARPADFDSKVGVIAERQLASDGRTSLQRWYDSL
jgi:hypothetical protein